MSALNMHVYRCPQEGLSIPARFIPAEPAIPYLVSEAFFRNPLSTSPTRPCPVLWWLLARHRAGTAQQPRCLLDASRCFTHASRGFPDVSICVQMLPDVSRCLQNASQMLPDAPQMPQNASQMPPRCLQMPSHMTCYIAFARVACITDS